MNNLVIKFLDLAEQSTNLKEAKAYVIAAKYALQSEEQAKDKNNGRPPALPPSGKSYGVDKGRV